MWNTVESSPQNKLDPDRSSPQRHASALDRIFVEKEDYRAKQTFNFEKLFQNQGWLLLSFTGAKRHKKSISNIL